MDKPVISVLGACGMLGTDVVNRLQQDYPQLRALDLPECDITDETALRGAMRGADIVINCAACTDVDGAEDNVEKAMRVNRDAVGSLGRIAVENGTWVVHFSTDYVFDGTREAPWTEDDGPGPLGAYGRSKLEGERTLQKSGCRHCILRVQWTYGQAGRHFVSKVRELAQERDMLRIVTDQVGSPTPTTMVADVVAELIEKQPEGLYHCAACGYATRLEMARVILDHDQWRGNLEPCTTADMPTPAARPLNTRLDCSKLKTLLGHGLPPWRPLLETYLEYS